MVTWEFSFELLCWRLFLADWGLLGDSSLKLLAVGASFEIDGFDVDLRLAFWFLEVFCGED